jgi:Asp-tRNA(Asn)/Glu-tRNA(Gln) amidotransferase A subunit family amidase
VASSKREEQPIAAYVDRAAAIVGLPIAAAHRSEVIEQFGRLLAVAALFYTQPISFIGLPVLAAPIAGPGARPRGIQMIGAPFTEALLFWVAAALEGMGVVGATRAEVPTVQARCSPGRQGRSMNR